MYKIPSSLKLEIQAYANQVNAFRSGTIEPVKFKAIRVPMGIYEQRNNGTFMIRVRCTAGIITPWQLKEVVKIASANNTLPIHFTTRQELQLHNVSLEQTPIIIEQLHGLGLATRGGGGNTVRNIMASVDAGVSPTELFDVSPYAIELTNVLISEPDSWLLPRKYKITFSGNNDDNAHAIFNDLGFIANIKNGQRGFKVFIGGGLGSNSAMGHLLFDFLPHSDIVYVAEAVKQLFSAHGNRRNRHKARLRYVFAKLGKEKVFELFFDIFEQLKKEQKYAFNFRDKQQKYSDVLPLSTSLTNEENVWKQRYVKEQKQTGYFMIEIPFENGIAAVDTLIKIAEFADSIGTDTIRITMRQNLLLRNIPGNKLSEIYNLLKQNGVETDVPALLNNIVACTGADTCRLGLCLSKGLSKAIKSELSKINEDEVDNLQNAQINISGCPNGCGQHATASLGFYGKVSRNNRSYPAYYVVAGGKSTNNNATLAKTLGEISARDVPVLIKKIVENYTLQVHNYSNFNDYIEKTGQELIRELLIGYKTIPSFENDKNYYFDWGANELFSVKGKGTAECSAGMFDMIDFDSDSIDELQKTLSNQLVENNANQALHQLVFHASRMLLITRGIEPKSRMEVFTFFIDVFIKEKYVDEKYLSIVKLVSDNPDAEILEFKDSIYNLVHEVKQLYASMDDSLQFKVDNTTDAVSKQNEDKISTCRTRDFRGVACPLNFVKTKIELAGINSGEILEVLLDDGEPIQNVPGSIKNEGHQIIEEKKVNNYWSVVIRKK